jgi:hypothetical protein
MTWDCGAWHYFDFLLRRCLAFNIFPFPVTTAKLIGEFYNNRQSAVYGCPRFAYSFVFLMLRQYYWRCESYSANRRIAANMKNPWKSFYWCYESAPLRLKARRTRTASPISVGRNAAPTILAVFSIYANSIGAKSLIALCLLFQNSPINWAVLTGNGNRL